jgi:hypothetical protein
MSSQDEFVTKDGRLSAKGLKRSFKDGVLPKKSAKRPKVAKAKPIEAQEVEFEEIPVSKTIKGSEEELKKKRRLQEAVETLVKCGANTKELLSAFAAAQAAQRTSFVAEDVTSSVSMPPDSPPHSLEEWQRANLERVIQNPRDGKDDGGLTPPMSRLLSECIPFSDVAAVVAATEQSKASLASVLSVSTRPAPQIHNLRTHVENLSALRVPLNDMTIPYKKSDTGP